MLTESGRISRYTGAAESVFPLAMRAFTLYVREFTGPDIPKAACGTSHIGEITVTASSASLFQLRVVQFLDFRHFFVPTVRFYDRRSFQGCKVFC